MDIEFETSNGFGDLSSHLSACGFFVVWAEQISDPRCRMTMWRCKDALVLTQDFGRGGSCKVFAEMGSPREREVLDVLEIISNRSRGIPTLH